MFTGVSKCHNKLNSFQYKYIYISVGLIGGEGGLISWGLIGGGGGLISEGLISGSLWYPLLQN